MTVYGIKNCDTVKKAVNWLKSNNKTFDFHDYKKEGITESKLKEWSNQVGWENLINRRGTTWRKLDDITKETVKDERHAIEIMLSHNSIIRRPIVEKDEKILAVGFDEEAFSAKL